MSKALGTVWPLETHTSKKHEILRRYFQAWLPILAQTNGRLLYLDGFAGPGEYSNGEDGSPLVVLKAARDHKQKFASELFCLFVEDRRDRYEHLVEVLASINPPLPSNIKFHAEHGAFNDQLSQIFIRLEEQKNQLEPTLAFVDPFGFSQTPFSTIAKLMKYPKCEVLVNFMYEEINRFLSLPNLAEHFDALFGTPEWREAIKISAPAERLRAIHDLYLKQLRRVAKHVRSFQMLNRGNIVDYFLFFATNNLTGLERMKEAMWKVDPTGEFQFSDFTDASAQLSLFASEPDYTTLRDMITSQFGGKEVESKKLGDWIVAHTPFLRSHFKKPVLVPMEDEVSVSVLNPKPGRRKGWYPDGTILRFR
jgi:three-Cys-motif partner protein